MSALRDRVLRWRPGRREAPSGPTPEPPPEPGPPALSVVMPVYDVEAYLDACIASVLRQSFTDLELIVVDDGSTDGSAAIAAAWAERDPRVVLVAQANAGLGAARNTGTARARGEFLAYVDSDDLVLPGAYLRMVDTLRETGSDFVVGSFVRGDDERATYVPDWVARVHAHRRTAISVDDHPEVVRDITAWNKVFRRSFWDAHDLTFPEGVVYEDQVIVTRALLASRRFDVLERPVYLWRTRHEGTSITQAKGSLRDLRDRLRSLQESWELVRGHGSPAVLDAWFAKWLGFDFLGYFEHALQADGEYADLLTEALASMHGDLRPGVLDDVPVYPRLMSYLLIQGRREAAEDVFVLNQRHHHHFGWPTERVGADRHVQVGLAPDVAPPEITRVTAADVQARCRLLAAHWDGDTLVLRGAALLTYVDERTLEVTLHDDGGGTTVAAEVSELVGDEYDQGSQRRYEDRAASGFEARVDLSRLLHGDHEATACWRVELTQTHDGAGPVGTVVRTGGFDRVSHIGTGPARSPRVVDGRSLRLTVPSPDLVEVEVARAWSEVVAAEPIGEGRLRLTVRSSPADPIVRLFHYVGDERRRLRPVSREADHVVVELGPLEVPARLHARHRSQERSATTVAAGLDAAPDVSPCLYAGVARAAQVRPPRTLVLVDTVATTTAPAEPGLVLGGRCLPVDAGTVVRLRLAGRTVSAPSAELGAGGFEVTVPVLADPWGLGRLPLPADDYALTVEGDPDALVTLGSAARAEPPDRVEAAGSTWSLAGGDSRISVIATASAPAERGARRQERLRETYAGLRDRPRRPAVLFECFYGRTVGDSPLAIHRELVRRGTDLDLVWGVKDWSVPVPAGGRGVLHSSAEWYELLARSAYLVTANNFPAFFAKAPGQVHLQTWHGTPLKRIGHDIVGDATVTRAYLRMMDATAAGWDHLISPSPYCSEIFPGAFRYAGPILEVGYPRNDVLVAPDRDARRADVRRRLGIAEDRRVVLYAPTWRDTVRVGNRPAKRLYLDPEELVRRAPDVTVLVRGHANTADGPSVNAEGTGPVRDVTAYPDVADLFLAADVLVTDYSSVMFDFTLVDRPIHLLVPDLEEYRDESRGFYLDLDEWAPGPLHRDAGSLLDALATPAPDPDPWAPARARMRERFCPLDDGAAAARVVDAVFSGPRSPGPPAPSAA